MRLASSFHADRYRANDPDRKFTISVVWVKHLRPRFLAQKIWCEHCLALGFRARATRVEQRRAPGAYSTLTLH